MREAEYGAALKENHYNVVCCRHLALCESARERSQTILPGRDVYLSFHDADPAEDGIEDEPCQAPNLTR